MSGSQGGTSFLNVTKCDGRDVVNDNGWLGCQSQEGLQLFSTDPSGSWTASCSGNQVCVSLCIFVVVGGQGQLQGQGPLHWNVFRVYMSLLTLDPAPPPSSSSLQGVAANGVLSASCGLPNQELSKVNLTMCSQNVFLSNNYGTLICSSLNLTIGMPGGSRLEVGGLDGLLVTGQCCHPGVPSASSPLRLVLVLCEDTMLSLAQLCPPPTHRPEPRLLAVPQTTLLILTLRFRSV